MRCRMARLQRTADIQRAAPTDRNQSRLCENSLNPCMPSPRLRQRHELGCRQRTIEHVFGTLKAWMGATHFLTKTLPNVKTEMSLQVLAYNLKRAIKILGASTLIAEMKS